MPNFHYEAHDSSGKGCLGQIEAKDDTEACEKLRDSGLFVREISTEPIKNPRYVDDYESAFIEDPNSPVDVRKPPESKPESVKAEGKQSKNKPARDKAQVVKVTAKEDSKKWESMLYDDLESISKVLSLMERWKAACKKTKKGESLPDGVPAVGGKTWELYEKHQEEIIAKLFNTVITSAVLNCSHETKPDKRVIF